MSRVDAISPARVKDAAPLFAALGDATRLGLLISLCASGLLSVTRLSSKFSVSRQAIAKHLDVLSEAGLVRSRRPGRARIWEFEPKRLDAVHQYLNRLSQQWDDALGRLKLFVERRNLKYHLEAIWPPIQSYQPLHRNAPLAPLPRVSRSGRPQRFRSAETKGPSGWSRFSR